MREEMRMHEVDKPDLFELYKQTLEMCGVYLLHENDETIGYCIYEEFDIGVHSFLHAGCLEAFRASGLISHDKLDRSLLLRSKVLALQTSGEWGIEHFRASPRWREIMALSDEIKSMQ